MLPRPSTSCQRLKHLTTSFECVWISEEDLCSAFQRFCGASNTIRRHGSSVPGPLESRRRLGRRRMAYATEMTQALVYDPGALWCSSWGPEKIQSQWEAPTPRITEQSKHPPDLPSWLTNWTPMPEELADVSINPAIAEEPTEKGYDILRQERHIQDHFHDFEMAMGVNHGESTELKGDWNTEKTKGRHQQLFGPKKALKLCVSFRKRLQQSLTLGLVTSDLLSNSLRTVTNVLVDIHSGSYSNAKGSSRQCPTTHACLRGGDADAAKELLTFYQQVWDGIVSCNVLTPADFDSKVIAEYLSLIADLPSTNETQLLVSEILPSLSAVQLGSNVDKILSIFNKWTLSWLQKMTVSTNRDKFLTKSETSLISSQRSINHLRMLMWSNRGKETPELLKHVRGILMQASTNLSAASTELRAAESMFLPHSHSIGVMSQTLTNLPKEITSVLIRSHSGVICSPTFWDQKSVSGLKDYLAQSHRIRLNWLSVLSRLKNIDNSIFTETFKILQQLDLSPFNLDTKEYTLTWRQMSELVLNRWTSQGTLTNSSVIIDTFKIKTLHSPSSFGWLLWTLKEYGQLSDEKIQDLFSFLRDIQAFGHIHAVLWQSKMFNLRINSNVLADLVNTTTFLDLQAAYNIYMQHCIGEIEPEKCAPLFARMIYHGSEGIWAALDAPIYAAMPKWKRKAPSPEILSQARVELIHEMARAFAHRNFEHPRQALRNVTQCWHYLRAHKVEPTSEISRAVTQVGIIADVRNEKWGRTERVRWVLDVIEKAEGPEVADAVRQAVAKWRQKLKIRLEKKKEGYVE
ncbi:uncharacterized protein EAF01_009596 [Botrytis porri]|uniref:Uncharacterized protein n=1 Tax=Botrytis porri TaxID=87229 RepID=A0A4Z1L404_9HELO|nr:uncharacterized protein EAF01_009596 [Botrytis porri]KAF7895634.1 hypothetical protein EAF01_009596 [Botrytis porri]TGO91535.1 hypothetical protein BPOR_0025g00290 [Botrytis porri]